MKTEIIEDETLKVKVPKINELNLPYPQNTGLKPYLLMGVFGERGSAKTTSVAHILSLNGKYQQRIYWFSSTVGHDEKVMKILEPLGDKVVFIEQFNKETLQEVFDEMKEISDKYLKHVKICERLNKRYKRIGAKKYYETLEDYLITLYELNEIEDLDEDYNYIVPPYQPQFSVIVDDELSNPLLMARTSKNGEFIKFIIKHRHYPYFCNVYLLLQNYSSVSNVIRRNLQQFFISGAITDNRLMKFIFEEVGSLFKDDFQKFKELLNYVSKFPYSFLFINKSNRELRKNLDEKIILE